MAKLVAISGMLAHQSLTSIEINNGFVLTVKAGYSKLLRNISRGEHALSYIIRIPVYKITSYISLFKSVTLSHLLPKFYK